MFTLNIINLIEFMTLIISFMCVFLAAMHKANEGQKLTVLVSALVFLVSLGASGVNSTANEELMIYANKIEYLGACNFFAAFTILYARFMDIRIPRWLKNLMIMLGITMTVITYTTDFSHFYYKSYEVIYSNGIPKLRKEYTFLHTAYVILICIYMATYIVMYVYRKFLTKQYKDNYSTLLGIVALAPMSAYIIEKFTNSSIELLPFGLLICDICLVYLIGNHFYDINSIALDLVFDNSDDAMIIENVYHEYEGSNKLAQRIFPSLFYLNIGDSINKKTPYVGYTLKEMLEQKDSEDNLICFDNHQYRIIQRDIMTRNNKGLVGHILTLKDITTEVEHEKLLESYKEELERDVEIKTQQLQKVQEQMVFGFASLVENKNMITGGHIKRTSAYVGAIGRELFRTNAYVEEVDEHFVKRLSRIAPLHDIGKVAVSEKVLDKPGKLTPEEFDLMKEHTTNGAKIIDRIMSSGGDNKDYQMARKIALFHHEKWNGTGYPKGLKGTEIPLCARIMAVADVFDALMSKRSYKEIYTLKESFEIMESERGTHFDPKILDAFFHIRPEIEAIYCQFRDMD